MYAHVLFTFCLAFLKFYLPLLAMNRTYFLFVGALVLHFIATNSASIIAANSQNNTVDLMVQSRGRGHGSGRGSGRGPERSISVSAYRSRSR